MNKKKLSSLSILGSNLNSEVALSRNEMKRIIAGSDCAFTGQPCSYPWTNQCCSPHDGCCYNPSKGFNECMSGYFGACPYP